MNKRSERACWKKKKEKRDTILCSYLFKLVVVFFRSTAVLDNTCNFLAGDNSYSLVVMNRIRAAAGAGAHYAAHFNVEIIIKQKVKS
jgi:hypothetical protein